MRTVLTALVLLVGQTTHPAPAQTVAFTHVHVVPMDREIVLEDYTVIVKNGVIAALGPSTSVKIPAGALVIQGHGRYIFPGLTDFHVHLRDESELLSYLAYGVTTVVHVSGPMANVPDLLNLRRRILSGQTLGPALYTTGRILDGDPPVFPGVSTVTASPDAARRAVAEQKQAGFDFIKVYNNLPPDALRAAIREAHAQGMAVIGHIPRSFGRAQALQATLGAGLDVIAHGEEYFFTYFYDHTDSLLALGRLPQPDARKIPAAVRLTLEAGAAVTPNLSFVAMTRQQLDSLDTVFSDPEAEYLHPDVLAMWHEQNPRHRPDQLRFDLRERAKYPFVQQLTSALQDADVLLLLGTDASAPGLFPGKSAHRELIELVRAGLTPYEALATGTVNPGRFIQEHVSSAVPFGTIAPGHRADLILVRGNPLADIQNASDIAGVMVRGQWLPRPELDQRRHRAAAAFGR